jgi:hypothetical protein
METRATILDNILYSSKTVYYIELFGIIRIIINIPKGKRKLKLGNVVLVLGFITNLVSLSLLTLKNIY